MADSADREYDGWRPLSRRRLLHNAGVGGAGLTAAAILACGGSTTKRAVTNQGTAAAGTAAATRASGAAQQPRRGGSFTHQNAEETLGEDLDPQTENIIKGQGWRLIYNGLLGYDPVTFNVRPELAQKWEQPSPTEYVFSLVPGVKWQNKAPVNGRLFSADDAIFSLNRARTDQPLFFERVLLSTIDQAQAVDKGTLRLTTKTPDAAFLNKVGSDGTLMLAPEVIAKFDKLSTAETGVGTGPFIITSVEQSVGSQYVRNPDYWKAGQPYLDQFRTVHFGAPGDARAFAAFQAGNIDVVLVPGSETKRFLAAQAAGYTPLWQPDQFLWFIVPNTSVKPFDDARVTKALRLLVNHQEFITAWAEVYNGRGQYASFIPLPLAEWDLTQQEYQQQLEWKQPKDDAIKEALSQLSAAGFTKDKPLKFELFGSTDLDYAKGGVELLQSQWRQLSQGVLDPTLKLTDSPTYQRVRAQRQFTTGFISNAAALTEVGLWLSIFHTGATQNYWNYSDSNVDKLIEQQAATLDTTQRKAIVKQTLNYLMANWPGVAGAGRYFLNAKKPAVQGFTPEFFMFGAQYDHVWLSA